MSCLNDRLISLSRSGWCVCVVWQMTSCVLYQTRLGLYKQAVPLAKSVGETEEVGPSIDLRLLKTAYR